VKDVRVLIRDLNPVLRGWGNYFRTGNANNKFVLVDGYVRHRLARFIKRRAGRTLRAGQLAAWSHRRFEELGLQVGRDDLAIRPNPATEPLHDGAGPSADLQATPTFANAEFLQAFDGERVEAGFNGCQPLALGLVLMGEEV
jgi:hypothetical protein